MQYMYNDKVTHTIPVTYKLTQVYNRYPCEKPLMEGVFVRTG